MGTDAGGSSGDEVDRRLQIRFTTKLGPPFSHEPPFSRAVPPDLTRSDLSMLLNYLLKNVNPDHKTLPFDFLVGGEFLICQTLEEFMLEKGIPAAEALVIEYIRAVAPRLQQDPAVYDEWITSLDGSNPRRWLSRLLWGTRKLYLLLFGQSLKQFFLLPRIVLFEDGMFKQGKLPGTRYVGMPWIVLILAARALR